MIKHKMYYDNQREWKRIGSQVSTGTAIQAPFTFYCVYDNDWSSSHNSNFWNKNFTTTVWANNEPTIKTIYDPSVSGFVLPKTAAYTGTTKTGGDTTNPNEYNISKSFDDGHTFYSIGWKDGDTLFCPALGFRDTAGSRGNNGALLYSKIVCYYWTLGASSTPEACAFHFDSNVIHTIYGTYRSYGCNVRSVIE